MNVRAAYSYTLTRPRFRELAPFLFFDYVRRRDISGNPNLVDHAHPQRRPPLGVVPVGGRGVRRLARSTSSSSIRSSRSRRTSNADATFLNAKGGNLIGGEIEARTTLGRIDSSALAASASAPTSR